MGGTEIGLRDSPNGFISEISKSTLPRAFYLAMPLDNAEPFVYETHNYNHNHKEEVGTGTSLCSMASLSANRRSRGVTARPATWKRRTVRPSRTDWWVSARRRPFRHWQTF